MITCGWCKTHYPNWTPLCPNCGGPLTAEKGKQLEEPPLPPRTLPKKFVNRLRWTQNVGLWAGAGLTVFGGTIMALMISVKTWAALIPGFFFLGGFFMLKESWFSVSRMFKALRHGDSVLGMVTDVVIDTTQHINHRYPWVIHYEFQTKESGQLHRGKAITWERHQSQIKPGAEIWVTYLSKKPEINAPYPPIG